MSDYARRTDGSEVSIFYLVVDAVPIAFPRNSTETDIRDIGIQYSEAGHTVTLHSHADSVSVEKL